MVAMFLKRIRLSLYKEDIGYRFNVHRSTISRCFHKVLPYIYHDVHVHYILVNLTSKIHIAKIEIAKKLMAWGEYFRLIWMMMILFAKFRYAKMLISS